MSAGTYNLAIDQGETFSFTITLKDGSALVVDLTGCSARGQIRSTVDSTTSYAFSFAFNTPATDGVILVSMSDTITSSLPSTELEPDSYVKEINYLVYDIELVRADGSISRILEGSVALSPEVTR